MKYFLSCLMLMAFDLNAQDADRVVRAEVVVNARIDVVWEAWTTVAGIKTFLAPGGKIEPRVFGAYNIYFTPDGKPDPRKAGGNVILAMQPPRMLSFSWDAPADFPNVSKQRTSVVVRFKELEGEKTRVTLIESGWGEGEEWDKVFAYFSSAWPDIVLARLKYRFEVGPLDWSNLPELK